MVRPSSTLLQHWLKHEILFNMATESKFYYCNGTKKEPHYRMTLPSDITPKGITPKCVICKREMILRDLGLVSIFHV